MFTYPNDNDPRNLPPPPPKGATPPPPGGVSTGAPPPLTGPLGTTPPPSPNTTGNWGGRPTVDPLGLSPSGGGFSGFSSSSSRPDTSSPLDPMMEKVIADILSGKSTRYSPEAVAAMKAQALEAREGNYKTGTDEMNRDLIKRGLFRSGIAAEGAAGLRRSVSATYSKALQSIQAEKAKADFEDRMAALQRAQQFLDSKRSYELGKEKNSIDRDMGESQLALGYARLEAERKALIAQFAYADKDFARKEPFLMAEAQGNLLN